MNPEETVVLKTFTSENEAIVAASRLGSEGIEAHIQKDDCGGAYPSLQMVRGVRLLVKPEDLENADRILDEVDGEDTGEVEEEERPKDSRRTGWNVILSFGLFGLGLAIGYYVSPELTDPSTYTGVLKSERYKNGTPGLFSYYVKGRLVRAEEDRNNDGKIDAWYKYTAGRIRSTDYDNNFDGKPDAWVTYKDQFNCTEKTDTDFDGKPDATLLFVHGLLQRFDWHPNDSAIITRRESFVHGVLTEALVDTDKDGIFDLKITYDPYERPIAKEKCRIPSYMDRR